MNRFVVCFVVASFALASELFYQLKTLFCYIWNKNYSSFKEN